jgi:hypothetical protein
MEIVHPDDAGYATPPSGYPYPQSYPQPYPQSLQPPTFPGGQSPDHGSYGEPPTDPEPYRHPGNGRDRRR